MLHQTGPKDLPIRGEDNKSAGIQRLNRPGHHLDNPAIDKNANEIQEQPEHNKDPGPDSGTKDYLPGSVVLQ